MSDCDFEAATTSEELAKAGSKLAKNSQYPYKCHRRVELIGGQTKKYASPLLSLLVDPKIESLCPLMTYDQSSILLVLSQVVITSGGFRGGVRGVQMNPPFCPAL